MNEAQNEYIRNMYIEVCKGSGFNLHWEDAVLVTSDILDILPCTVGYAFKDLKTLNLIALGLDPTAPNPKLKIIEK